MCGIAGVYYRDPARNPKSEVLKAMGDAIAHRGPDAEGFLNEAGIGLVHRRLSIIDLSGGDQPIGNEDGSVQVILNGEIYNYKLLRASLEARGHRFQTQSDTEVIVHLYEDEGEQLVDRLRGMFAFALWDRSRRNLLLARDRLGIKPLYVYRDGDKLLFSSELKGILAHPGVPREIDVAALEDYLAYGIVPGPRTIFRGIEKLPPGHTILMEPGNWQHSARRYWRLNLESDDHRTIDDWQQAIRAKVDDSVRAHLIADVPVGAFLSGGVDSAVVVASASAAMAGPLQTFSLGFLEKDFCELTAARATAVHFSTNHVEDIVAPDAAHLLDQLTHHFDEPFADSSAIPTFLLAQLASRTVKVALSGDGGDEAFGGYSRYAHDLRESALRRWMPTWLRHGFGPLARVWPKTDWLPRALRAKTFLTNMSLDAGAAYANTLQINRQPQRRQLLNPQIVAALNGHRSEDSVCSSYAEAPRSDSLAGMISADIAMHLPDDYLVKVDRASMAHGLEVRPPLLDHEFLELAARVPSRWKIHRNETKWIFKTAYRDRLPGGTTNRPKQGFEVPIDVWLRGPLRGMFESGVLAPKSRIAEFIDQNAARALYQTHLSGLGRHGNVLWSLLVLAKWCDRYLSAT